jgi:hypothetical protein
VAARQHSQEMLELNYFSHVSPHQAWADPPQRAYYAGAWEAHVGENIGKDYSDRPRAVAEVASALLAGWMGSKEHRENILSREYTHLGIGVVQRNGWYCGTQVFARRYYDVQQVTLREVTERMIRVRFEVATKAASISVWVNQHPRGEVKAERPGPTTVELAFPRGSGTQDVWLATGGKVRFTARLDTSRPLREAFSAKPYGKELEVTRPTLQEVEQTNYLLSGRARLLQPMEKVRLFLDHAHLENLSWNEQREVAWTMHLPKGSGRHQIGLFPDQWKKYLFFVDTDQPLARAFVPRFSPY